MRSSVSGAIQICMTAASISARFGGCNADARICRLVKTKAAGGVLNLSGSLMSVIGFFSERTHEVAAQLLDAGALGSELRVHALRRPRAVAENKVGDDGVDAGHCQGGGQESYQGQQGKAHGSVRRPFSRSCFP